MPKLKKDRRQPQRTAVIPSLDPVWVQRRVKRHLNDLERSNYTEPSAGQGTYTEKEDDGLDREGEGGAGGERDRGKASMTAAAREGDFDANGKRRKKSTMAVRSLLLYRKSLATLIDESNLAKLPLSTPSYLTSASLPSRFPPLQLCSVCGYKPLYACQRCGLKYCSAECKGVHDEMRCERR